LHADAYFSTAGPCVGDGRAARASTREPLDGDPGMVAVYQRLNRAIGTSNDDVRDLIVIPSF